MYMAEDVEFQRTEGGELVDSLYQFLAACILDAPNSRHGVENTVGRAMRDKDLDIARNQAPLRLARIAVLTHPTPFPPRLAQ